MGKHSTAGLKRWPLIIAVMLTVSTVILFFIRASYDSCDSRHYGDNASTNRISMTTSEIGAEESPLSFMKSKLVLLVSHELSLSGTAVS